MSKGYEETLRGDDIVIKITEGEFRGFIYSYGGVEVIENDDKSEASLRFDYDIIEPSEKMDDETQQRFGKHIGDILVELIMEGLEKGTNVYKGGT